MEDNTTSRRLQVGTATGTGLWQQPYTPPYAPSYQPNTTHTIYWGNYMNPTLTDAQIDQVAERVIEKLKADVLSSLLAADPKAVAQLLLKALDK